MFIDAKQIKEHISICQFLASLGYFPNRRSGKEYFYHSMIRDSDSVPSFCVYDRQGLWYDHGVGTGGTVIDLAKHLWPELAFNDLLLKIQATADLQVEPLAIRPDEHSKHENECHYAIRKIREAGTNAAITNYMKSRGVWNPGNPGYKEVYYSVDNGSGEQRHYFAAGWQNQKGGWEVRNKYFKGCLGERAITLVDGNNQRLAVFEGYLDYLSCRKEFPDFCDTVIVLNGTAMAAEVKRVALGFNQIRLFLDHGEGGRLATAKLLCDLPHAVDASDMYKGFDDYNEKLMSSLNLDTALKTGRIGR